MVLTWALLSGQTVHNLWTSKETFAKLIVYSTVHLHCSRLFTGTDSILIWTWNGFESVWVQHWQMGKLSFGKLLDRLKNSASMDERKSEYLLLKLSSKVSQSSYALPLSLSRYSYCCLCSERDCHVRAIWWVFNINLSIFPYNFYDEIHPFYLSFHCNTFYLLRHKFVGHVVLCIHNDTRTQYIACWMLPMKSW
jgi:hypothetical protein